MSKLQALVDRLTRISEQLRWMPRSEWGTVTGVAPLRVQLDGDEEPLEGSPSTVIGNLGVGVRVRVELQNRRATVTGRGDDTDWSPVTVPGVASGVCEWMRLGGVVYLRFDLILTTAIAAGAAIDPFFNLPAEAAPSAVTVVDVSVGASTDGSGVAWLSGGVRVRNTSSGVSASVRGAAQWPAKNQGGV